MRQSFHENIIKLWSNDKISWNQNLNTGKKFKRLSENLPTLVLEWVLSTTTIEYFAFFSCSPFASSYSCANYVKKTEGLSAFYRSYTTGKLSYFILYVIQIYWIYFTHSLSNTYLLYISLFRNYWSMFDEMLKNVPFFYENTRLFYISPFSTWKWISILKL